MELNNSINLNLGNQYFGNSCHFDFGLRSRKESKKEKEVLTKEILKQKVDGIEPMIMSKRMYFVVCKYMMWEELCPEDDFKSAIKILKELYPGIKLNYSNIIALNKDSFAGTLEEWDYEDCPLKRKKAFHLYLGLALALMNV